MPYLNYDKFFAKPKNNAFLVEKMRAVSCASPPIDKYIQLHENAELLADREYVGLVFNRAVHESLISRWNVVNDGHSDLLSAVKKTEDTLEDMRIKETRAKRDKTHDELTNKTLQSRISATKALIKELEDFSFKLQATIALYGPYQKYLRAVADKMDFYKEIEVVHRYQTLSLFKKEMVDSSLNDHLQFQQAKKDFSTFKTENEHLALNYAKTLNALSTKLERLTKSNEWEEDRLYTQFQKASSSSRATFNVIIGIRSVHQTSLKYMSKHLICKQHTEGAQADEEDPFVMLDQVANCYEVVIGICNEVTKKKKQGQIPRPVNNKILQLRKKNKGNDSESSLFKSNTRSARPRVRLQSPRKTKLKTTQPVQRPAWRYSTIYSTTSRP